MAVLTMLIGIPGSGKSTYGAKFLKSHPQTVYVSSDAMRLKLFGDEEYQKGNREVFAAMEAAASQALREGKDVLWDSTNTRSRDRKRTIEMAHSVPNTVVNAVVFRTLLSVSLIRNAKRKRVVPDDVIRRMYFAMEMPEYGEGYQEIKYVYCQK